MAQVDQIEPWIAIYALNLSNEPLQRKSKIASYFWYFNKIFSDIIFAER